MKRFLSLCLLVAAVSAAMANDGTYYVSGNQLVPLKETDIAITKEILTINIGDDSFANVDVYYEMMNRGPAKTVDMGFEADMSYNSGDAFSPQGIHPCIKDFTVTFNGTRLQHSNAVVIASDDENPSNFKPVDLRRWHIATSGDFTWNDGNSRLVDNQGNELQIAYAYTFKANFKAGKNIVHHTYRYKMSNGVFRAFEIPYKLTPATRWANHGIDDFTLRIDAKNTAKYFYIANGDKYAPESFKVTEGKGKVRMKSETVAGTIVEVTLRNGTVEWHAKNFRPKHELYIGSMDGILSNEEDWEIGDFYDRSGFFPRADIDYRRVYGRAARNKEEKRELVGRILRNLPYADRGYVFNDENLRKYFNSKWWYMPDPNWKMSTDDFTENDWRVINELSKNVILTDEY